VGQVETLPSPEGSRRPLEQGEPVGESRGHERVGELGAGGIVTGHDQHRQRVWWGPRSGSLAEKQEKKEHEGHEGQEEDDVWSRD
jgi:hypothetical protein